MLREQTGRDLGVRDFVHPNIVELGSCYSEGGNCPKDLRGRGKIRIGL